MITVCPFTTSIYQRLQVEMDYPTNIKLLLLQLVLEEQEKLAHSSKKLQLADLMTEPIVDAETLERFTKHPLSQLYAPELGSLTVRGLRSAVRDLFDGGVADDTGVAVPVTVVTLANYYYAKRIQELEKDELPKLKEEIEAGLKTISSENKTT